MLYCFSKRNENMQFFLWLKYSIKRLSVFLFVISYMSLGFYSYNYIPLCIVLRVYCYNYKYLTCFVTLLCRCSFCYKIICYCILVFVIILYHRIFVITICHRVFVINICHCLCVLMIFSSFFLYSYTCYKSMCIIIIIGHLAVD